MWSAWILMVSRKEWPGSTFFEMSSSRGDTWRPWVWRLVAFVSHAYSGLSPVFVRFGMGGGSCVTPRVHKGLGYSSSFLNSKTRVSPGRTRIVGPKM